MFESMSAGDLVRIAAAGAGFRTNVESRSVPDIVRIAAAASTNGARLIFTGADSLSATDIVRIGAAGRGAVQFDNH